MAINWFKKRKRRHKVEKNDAELANQLYEDDETDDDDKEKPSDLVVFYPEPEDDKSSSDDTFDSITRISVEVAALAAGAAVGMAEPTTLIQPIEVAAFATASSAVTNMILSAAWKDKPGILSAIKNVTKAKKTKELHDRQLQEHLQHANQQATNMDFKVDAQSMIELQEFTLLLPGLANFTNEAEITVTDKQTGQQIDKFALADFSSENPPQGIQTQINHLIEQDINKINSQQSQSAMAAESQTPTSNTFKEASKPVVDATTQLSIQQDPQSNKPDQDNTQRRI